VTSPLLAALLGIAGLVAALALLPPFLARLAGWPRLANRFGSAPPLPLTPLGYATLGTLSTTPVKLSASPQGLVLSQVFTFFRYVPAVLVPWNDVQEDESRLGFLAVPFSFPPEKKPMLLLKPHVAKRLRPYLAGR
jgi:hypothetical protein